AGMLFAAVGVAGLVGMLISNDRAGAEVAAYLVQASLVAWAAGLIAYAARQAVTRPWSWRSTVGFLLLPVLAVWCAAVWAVTAHPIRPLWLVWPAAYVGPLVLFGALAFVLPTHRLEALYRRLSPRETTVPASDLAPKDGDLVEQAKRRRAVGVVAAGLLVL